MARPKSKTSTSKSTASLGFEAKLWLTAASESEKTHRSADLLAPYKGCIYDPACGSGGVIVQSKKFVEFHA